MPAVTISLTGELRPGRGDGRRGAGSGFGRQRPSTPTVVSGWERLAAVRLRSAATAAPAVADAPSAPGRRNHSNDRQQSAPVRADPFRFRAGRFGSPGDQLRRDAALVSSPGDARVSRSCRLNFQARGV